MSCCPAQTLMTTPLEVKTEKEGLSLLASILNYSLLLILKSIYDTVVI